MRSRGWLILGLIVLAIVVLVVVSQHPAGDQGVRPPNWPDLTVLTNYTNPFGDTCSADGTTSRGNLPKPDKLDENHLKNRFLLPSTYAAFTVDKMLDLPGNEDASLDNSGVALTGYVRDVKPGGSEGESCNCEAKKSDELDAHIEVIADPSHQLADGKGVIIVEVTERSRRLATAGLLHSNIGTDWSTRELRNQLAGHWVKFSGWLFYDSDHVEESWSVDSTDDAGRRNWRGSPWEVHPVMGIELLPARPDMP
jgi:hypothetical protein